MKLHRTVLLVVFAALVGSCLAPVMSHATVPTGDRPIAKGSCAQNIDASMDRPLTGPKCIPCSANHPCANPLTVCSFNGSSPHGCCLGFAGN